MKTLIALFLLTGFLFVGCGEDTEGQGACWLWEPQAQFEYCQNVMESECNGRWEGGICP